MNLVRLISDSRERNFSTKRVATKGPLTRKRKNTRTRFLNAPYYLVRSAEWKGKTTHQKCGKKKIGVNQREALLSLRAGSESYVRRRKKSTAWGKGGGGFSLRFNGSDGSTTSEYKRKSSVWTVRSQVMWKTLKIAYHTALSQNFLSRADFLERLLTDKRTHI